MEDEFTIDNTSNEKVSLENRFERLEDIVSKMEKTDVTLEESFDLYKKGLDELKKASEMIDGIEKSMLVLNSEGVPEEF